MTKIWLNKIRVLYSTLEFLNANTESDKRETYLDDEVGHSSDVCDGVFAALQQLNLKINKLSPIYEKG